MRRGICLGVIIAVGATAMVAAAFAQPQQQQPAPKAVLEIQKLKDNLYIIPTGHATGPGFIGGNTLVFVAEKGVVVVDTKVAGYGQQILDRIKSVSDKPVTMIINTHTHNDHTGSNTEFPATVEFVAHENTKANLSKAECPPVTNCAAFKGENAKYLPKTTFQDKRSLMSGRDRIDLYHFGPGHTNGDAFIVFTEARVMHAGDMFAWKDAPFIDMNNGASGIQFPATLAKAIAGIKNVDTVVGGHQPPAPWSDFQAWQRFMQDLVTLVQDAFKAGKTPEEALASLSSLPEKHKGYTVQRAKGAVTAIYAELGKK